MEYRKYIEKDSALERRFQPVIVNEPSIEDAVEIIEGVAPYYEAFHQCEDHPRHVPAWPCSCRERYITDRFLPDKAIDLIDEACSDVNLQDKNSGPQHRKWRRSWMTSPWSGRSWWPTPATRPMSGWPTCESKELQLRQEQKELGQQEDAHPDPGQSGPGDRAVDQDPRQHRSRSRSTSAWPSWKTG